MMRMGIAAQAFAAVIILGTSARGQACETSCSMYVEGHCVQYTQHCTTPEAPPKPSFGAIAYGRTKGTWGTSYRWETREKAESVALENCAKQGSRDCEVMVWFDRKCGALASGEGPDGFWGLADAVGPARADAKSKCISSGNKGCEVLAAQCSR